MSLSEEDLDKITEYILKIYDSRAIEEDAIEKICELTRQDKKNEGGKINCSLLEVIGNCTYNIEIDDDDIRSSIAYFNGVIGN